jgi:hypothetical protein
VGRKQPADFGAQRIAITIGPAGVCEKRFALDRIARERRVEKLFDACPPLGVHRRIPSSICDMGGA